MLDVKDGFVIPLPTLDWLEKMEGVGETACNLK